MFASACMSLFVPIITRCRRTVCIGMCLQSVLSEPSTRSHMPDIPSSCWSQCLPCSAADPAHSTTAVASPTQLLTYSSLPPMAPALAAPAADQLPPRQRSIKWPVAAASGRTADQPSASYGKPTVQPATDMGSSEAGATTDQVRA